MRIEVSEPESVVLVPSTPEHPHNGEADMIHLKNGDLLLAYGQWCGKDDLDEAEIRYITSSDGGRTWDNDSVLLPNEGNIATYSVSLLRMQNDEILMSYGVRESLEDRTVYFRKSSDECKTWSPRVKLEVPPAWYSGYTGISNNRLIQLRSGRILAAAWAGWANDKTIIGFTAYSDDFGQTWRKSDDVDIRTIDPSSSYGADDPAVVELKDGRVMMLVSTELGCLAKSYSKDQGKTWTRPVRVRELVAPKTPATIARIPATGDLLLVWNYNTTECYPLNSMISKDDGKTWSNLRVIDDSNNSSYVSITPVDDRILLTYWSYDSTGTSLILKSFDYRWFYQKNR
ncbi:glycoside hydrolase [bacterium]|nr:glycoside hydrolase [bacterium]